MTVVAGRSRVAVWIAAGLFAMAASRLVLLAMFCANGDSARVAAIGDVGGGLAIAFGWSRVLAPDGLPRGQRVVAVIGALTALALVIAGVSSCSAGASAPATLWIAIAAAVPPLLASVVWSGSDTPVIAILGWLFLPFIGPACFENTDVGAGVFEAAGSVLALLTWLLAGIAILDVRIGPRDSRLPSAILRRP